MMGENGATTGTARDLRARVVLALIAISNGKPNGGRAAALVEEARTIMEFITSEAEGEADATSAGRMTPWHRQPIGPPKRERSRWHSRRNGGGWACARPPRSRAGHPGRHQRAYPPRLGQVAMPGGGG